MRPQNRTTTPRWHLLSVGGLHCISAPCRSLQIASDLDSLARVSKITNRSLEVNATQQAVACCEYIARLGAIAGEEQEEEFRAEAVLR